MLIPRRVKHRKQHHPARAGKSKGGTEVAFGDFGIQALEHSYVTNRQIEADRKSTRLNSSHIPLSRMPSSA